MTIATSNSRDRELKPRQGGAGTKSAFCLSGQKDSPGRPEADSGPLLVRPIQRFAVPVYVLDSTMIVLLQLSKKTENYARLTAELSNLFDETGLVGHLFYFYRGLRKLFVSSRI